LIPIFFIFLIIQVRAALPRYRYDQLIKLGWKELLLISFSCMFLLSIVLLSLI
jgi:NADH-quinone oxidoreductase subunit H